MNITRYQQRVNEAILAHLSRFRKDHPIVGGARYVFSTGGKRIRPVITLMMAEAVGGGEWGVERALPGALAVEFFHAASLIADDLPCMDDDDSRRGKPSCHKKFGESLALLTSYGLISEAFGLLSKAPARVMALLLDMTAHATGFEGACLGQELDLRKEDMDTSEGYVEVNARKTATLFELAFVYGLGFGSESLERVEQVQALAKHFGQMFQIYDDMEDGHHSRALQENILAQEVRAYFDILEQLDIGHTALRELPRIARKCMLKGAS